MKILTLIIAISILSTFLLTAQNSDSNHSSKKITINSKDDGYRGIWYMNQPSNDEYVYKYSGGLGTYCAKHQPFAVYRAELDKTFFCYGGTAKGSHQKLLHLVSYFDHKTGLVPRPTILLDKQTKDAHDNPVISIDSKGYIWIFSTSHGTARPSYIHKSKLPYNIDEFELIPATKIGIEGPQSEHPGEPQQVALTNFSYMQAWFIPDRKESVLGGLFCCFFTKYNFPAKRTICFMTSQDGINWSKWSRLAAIDEGHYQISAAYHEGSRPQKVGSVFNFHPQGKGLNWRTNLYYIETKNYGQSWQAIDGTELTLPLTTVKNPALIHDYLSEKLNVYLKDIHFDAAGNPVILFITSKGYASGPANDPRTWTTARWTGDSWEIQPAMISDNNYDMGSIYLEQSGDQPDNWRIIGPTETGPQPYNPGGEMASWISQNQGKSWQKVKQLTSSSSYNHTYARRPVDAHPDFYAFWADGHGRKPSESRLYFCDQAGKVYMLPPKMSGDFSRPILIQAK